MQLSFSLSPIRLVLWVIALLVAPAIPTFAQQPIEGQLTFSTDGGRTFTSTSPIVPVPQLIEVRAQWRGVRDNRPIEADIIRATLLSEESDFASANRGEQKWDARQAWYQALLKNYTNARRDGEMTYSLDLRAREANIKGYRNVVDPKTGEVTDGLLPAIAARKNGSHRFTFRLSYQVLDSNGKRMAAVNQDFPFVVLIDPSTGNTNAKQIATSQIEYNAPPERLPALEGIKVYPSTEWKIVGGKATLDSQAPFVRPRISEEITLKIAESGRYFLRLQTESGNGSGHGEEQLALEAPWIFLNGRPIAFSRATPLVSWRGTYITIIESTERVQLNAGDEIRWNSAVRGTKYLGGLALATTPLKIATGDVAQFYDPDLHDAFRLTGEMQTETVGKRSFRLSLQNVSGKQERFDAVIEVRDFWQKVLVRQRFVSTLSNRATEIRSCSWDLSDSDRYRAIVRVRASSGLSREKVFDVLVDNPFGARPRLWLNNNWQWASLKDDGTLATRTIGEPSSAKQLTDWQKVDLPASWVDTRPNDHVGWYQRQFSVPQWLNGRRLKLHFSRVSFESRIFLNGKAIGEHFGHGGPFEIDVTNDVRPGSNELWVGVRGSIAALEPVEWTNPQIALTSRSQFRAPEPIRSGVGEIWLDGTGSSPIKDVFIKSSYRKNQLALDIELPSLRTGHIVTNRILYEGKEVLRFPSTTVSAGSGHTLKLVRGWDKPILWNPGNPRLLQLVSELRDAQGKLVDRKDTRFGFREFWPEGRQLMWNGIPMKFAALPFLSHWGWSLTERSKRSSMRDELLLSKRLGVTMHRHIYDPEARAEINDEEGIVMAQGFGGVVNPTGQKLESKEFWRNAEAIAQEGVRGLRNHPSIISWYLSNEFFAASDVVNSKPLIALGNAVRALDGTRIIEFGCDLDLGGHSSIISTHYPVDVRAMADEGTVFPEGFYWHRFDKPLQAGQNVPSGMAKHVANVRGESPITWGKKPIVVNETLWNFFFLPPDGLTRLMGEDVYRSPMSVETAFKLANAGFTRGHRDAEVSVITPWEWVHRGPTRYLPPVEINPLQNYRHFYAGQRVHFDINLHHDRPRSANLTWVWSLDGTKTGNATRRTLSFGPAELKREKVEFTLPTTVTNSELHLNLRLFEGLQELRHVSLPVHVNKRESIVAPSGTRYGLYDPSGSARTALASVTSLRQISILNDASVKELDVLILGESLTISDSTQIKNLLDNFVKGGGRVLVLMQTETPKFLPFALTTTQLNSNRAWTFQQGHPLLKNVRDDELADWFPDERIGSQFYLKPEIGDFRTIVEAGGPNGLVYSGMLERPWGEGQFVFTQLNLVKNLDKNPVASKLWRNLLSYLAQKAPTRSRVGFWGDSGGELAQAMLPLAPRVESISTPQELTGLNAVLIDGEKPLTTDMTAALSALANQGATIWVHGVTPKNRETITGLTKRSIELRKPAPLSFQGRADKIGISPRLAGVTLFDLFWKKRVDSEVFAGTFYNRDSAPVALGDWSMDVEGGSALLFPNLFVEVPIGKGIIVLDNLNWQAQDYAVRRPAQRLASILLTNLGVVLEGGRTLDIPTSLTYRKVDLSSVANREFVDDVDDDGLGGWTDQGRDADFRNFPTNPEQTFNGVPFHIASPRGAVVLSSPRRKAGPPQSAELPVSGRADVLFFLQTSAWTSKRQHASYIVHYTDGSTHEIPLIGGVNLRDWVAPDFAAAFPYETETRTQVAWTGKTVTSPSASLFLMAWPNPHPERAIRSITFESKNFGVPVLVGVTVGVKTTPPEATVTANTTVTDAANARALVYVKQQAKDWAGAVTAIKQWLAIDRDNLEALFLLGKAYEEIGDFKAAEQTYRQSLEINRNQPEVLRTLEAVTARKP